MVIESVKQVLSEIAMDNLYYDRLYESCSPKHFKEIEWFSPNGKTMPNGYSIQRGGFIKECKDNANSFVLSEDVHSNQYGLSDYRGGIIVFSTDVNAVSLSHDVLKNKLKTIITNFQQRFFSDKKLNKLINKFNKYNKKYIGAYSIGNSFKGKYVGDNGEEYNERSMSVEINGLSSKGLLYLGEMIARAFHQESVLIKDLNQNKIYLANGLRRDTALDLSQIGL